MILSISQIETFYSLLSLSLSLFCGYFTLPFHTIYIYIFIITYRNSNAWIEHSSLALLTQIPLSLRYSLHNWPSSISQMYFSSSVLFYRIHIYHFTNLSEPFLLVVFIQCHAIESHSFASKTEIRMIYCK